MKAGGTITIEARNVRLRRGALSDADLAGDFVLILIGDTGIGIPSDHLEHVFEPFFTTKEASRASGLGLSQVHGFARQLGGTVEITSTVGEGTTVALYLPRSDIPARIGSKAELDDIMDDDEDAPGAADVLVVDDEVEVALALQSMLQESGYRVRTAVGADEALEVLESRAFQLVLTDVTMPGSMDGAALAREIRNLYPGLPVVLITGNPMVVAGASEFPLLQKPIASRDLRAAIQRYLAPGDEENQGSPAVSPPEFVSAPLSAWDPRVSLRSPEDDAYFHIRHPRTERSGDPRIPGRCGLCERREEPLLRAFPDQKFRMPLHADEEAARSRPRSPARCRSRPAPPPRGRARAGPPIGGGAHSPGRDCSAGCGRAGCPPRSRPSSSAARCASSGACS